MFLRDSSENIFASRTNSSVQGIISFYSALVNAQSYDLTATLPLQNDAMRAFEGKKSKELDEFLHKTYPDVSSISSLPDNFPPRVKDAMTNLKVLAADEAKESHIWLGEIIDAWQEELELPFNRAVEKYLSTADTMSLFLLPFCFSSVTTLQTILLQNKNENISSRDPIIPNIKAKTPSIEKPDLKSGGGKSFINYTEHPFLTADFSNIYLDAAKDNEQSSTVSFSSLFSQVFSCSRLLQGKDNNFQDRETVKTPLDSSDEIIQRSFPPLRVWRHVLESHDVENGGIFFRLACSHLILGQAGIAARNCLSASRLLWGATSSSAAACVSAMDAFNRLQDNIAEFNSSTSSSSSKDSQMALKKSKWRFKTSLDDVEKTTGGILWTLHRETINLLHAKCSLVHCRDIENAWISVSTVTKHLNEGARPMNQALRTSLAPPKAAVGTILNEIYSDGYTLSATENSSDSLIFEQCIEARALASKGHLALLQCLKSPHGGERSGNVNIAIEALERASVLDPLCSRIKENYVHALLANGQPDLALEQVKLWMKMDSGSPDAWMMTICVLVSVGKVKEAEELCELAAEEFSHWFETSTVEGFQSVANVHFLMIFCVLRGLQVVDVASSEIIVDSLAGLSSSSRHQSDRQDRAFKTNILSDNVVRSLAGFAPDEILNAHGYYGNERRCPDQNSLWKSRLNVLSNNIHSEARNSKTGMHDPSSRDDEKFAQKFLLTIQIPSENDFVDIDDRYSLTKWIIAYNAFIDAVNTFYSAIDYTQKLPSVGHLMATVPNASLRTMAFSRDGTTHLLQDAHNSFCGGLLALCPEIPIISELELIAFDLQLAELSISFMRGSETPKECIFNLKKLIVRATKRFELLKQENIQCNFSGLEAAIQRMHALSASTISDMHPQVVHQYLKDCMISMASLDQINHSSSHLRTTNLTHLAAISLIIAACVTPNSRESNACAFNIEPILWAKMASEAANFNLKDDAWRYSDMKDKFEKKKSSFVSDWQASYIEGLSLKNLGLNDEAFDAFMNAFEGAESSKSNCRPNILIQQGLACSTL